MSEVWRSFGEADRDGTLAATGHVGFVTGYVILEYFQNALYIA